MNLHELNQPWPRIGKVYLTSVTDPRKSDLVGVPLGVIGFRNSGRQVKVVMLDGDMNDVDNFDLADIKLDSASERDPTAAERVWLDRRAAFVAQLPAES